MRLHENGTGVALRRRAFLRAGLCGLGGLTLPGLLALRARAAVPGTTERTALIVVWLQGGASHLETYDPKPDAPAEIRGPYGSIPTRVPGLNISELLPRHALVADKFVVLRSLVHTGFCHQQGNQRMFTGHPVQELKLRPDHPDLFCIANKVRADRSRPLPVYVGVSPIPYLGSAYLGPTYEPFVVAADPNAPGLRVAEVGLTDRAQIERVGSRIARPPGDPLPAPGHRRPRAGRRRSHRAARPRPARGRTDHRTDRVNEGGEAS